MKIKLIGTLSLSALLLLSGCGGSANTNATNNTVAATPTAVPKTNVAANTDPNLKPKIEEALKKKGFTDVTVDTTTTPATIRGTVAKGKLDEAVQTAQEANGGKPVKNEVKEK